MSEAPPSHTGVQWPLWGGDRQRVFSGTITEAVANKD